MDLQFFKVETDAQGITVVSFDRPPVNAVSTETFLEIGQLADAIAASETTKVVVLACSPRSRTWCGGVDLNDMAPLDREGRMKRYAKIRDTLPRFYRMDRPVIAAIDGPAVGVGFILASLCDMRVAAADTFFAFPEINRSFVAAGGGTQLRLGFPAAKLREMIYTGSRYITEELRDTGFFNYIVPREQVMAKAMQIAEVIAKKSLPALKANKLCNNDAEYMTWEESFDAGQEYSFKLAETHDVKEGIKSFLEKRPPVFDKKA